MTETTPNLAPAPKPPRPDRKRWWVRADNGKWRWSERSLQNGRTEAAQPHETAPKGQP